MAAAAITFADGGQVDRLGRGIPGVAADGDLGALLGTADGHVVNGAGKEVIRNELVETLAPLVRHVEEENAVLELAPAPDQVDKLEVPLVKLIEGLANNRQGRNLGQGPDDQLGNDDVGHETLGPRALDHQRELGSRLAHLHRRLRVRVLGAVDDVLQRRGIEAEFLARDVGDEFGAGTERRIVELPVAGVAAEVLGVRLGKERALVMVEPPGQAVGARVFEIDDGVFVAVKDAGIEKLAGTVRQPVVAQFGSGIDAGAVEVSEDRGGASAIEALVMKADSYHHHIRPGRALESGQQPKLVKMSCLRSFVKKKQEKNRNGKRSEIRRTP